MKLIKMVRDEHYGKPFSADVHPDEVENYKKGGFRVAVNDETKETKETTQTEGQLPVAPTESAIATPAEELAAIETTILARHAEGKNSREIGAEVGWTWQRVASTLKRHGK